MSLKQQQRDCSYIFFNHTSASIALLAGTVPVLVVEYWAIVMSEYKYTIASTVQETRGSRLVDQSTVGTVRTHCRQGLLAFGWTVVGPRIDEGFGIPSWTWTDT